jgi:glycerate 2-kinase
MAPLLGGELRRASTVDAAHRAWEGSWWWSSASQTALVESARVIGLALLPPGKHHPFELDTFGLGAVLLAAFQAGSKQVLIGIGGSATNDGGFGLARALGWTFARSDGTFISNWTELGNLAHVRPPGKALGAAEILVAVDVQNPLLGALGASRIYGPQKGLRPGDFPLAEASLARLAEVVRLDLGLDAATEPGTGAAGGLGFGLRCFFNARLESGFELFARCARLEERIAVSDLVITGEGAIDPSTLMGKGVGELARLCRKHGVPCIGLAGTLISGLPTDTGASPFARLHGITPQLTSPEDAKSNAQHWLPRLATVAAQAW